MLFAVVAALAVDAVGLVLVFSVGYHVAKRVGERQMRTSFVAINRALIELPPLERERIIKAAPDKIFGLLQAATMRRKAAAAKAQGDAQAVAAERRA
jgi:hypothetical protein